MLGGNLGSLLYGDVSVMFNPPFLGTQRVLEDHPSEHLTNYIGELCVYKNVCSFFVPLSH